jgi:hypothetical protein
VRQVFRILGSRYGAAIALLAVIALVVGAGKLIGGGGRPAPPVGAINALPTATVSQLADDGVDTPPSPPVPSTSAGAADPRAVALSFTQAWLHHTGVTAQQWFDGIAPYSTPALKDQMTGADPESVQASTVSGDPSEVARSESFVNVVVPLDAGTLTLGLSATDGRWLVDSVDWDRP